jgi:LmbE family N-acetylglucosaminyl deacetylase
MSLNILGNSKRCLVIAAHPDDEVLGVGGTIAKLSKAGTDIAVLYMTGGKSGRKISNEVESDDIKKEQEILSSEIQKSCASLGVKKYKCFNFPDNRLDTVSRMDISIKISEFASSFKPDLVFTHHSGDYNWDHTITYDATLMSFRANFGDHYPDAILSYEVLSSSERSAQNANHIFCPNLFVDISSTVDSKKNAIGIYESELKHYPHPRSIEAVEYLARKRGQEVGWTHAEAFQIVRILQH